MVRKTSAQGIELIVSFEGLMLEAYKAVSSEPYYTIGYGHCGKDVKKGMKITKQQALSYLQSDLAKFEQKVNKYDSKYNFTQNQFDALVSFAYNIGSIDELTKYGTRSIQQIEETIPKYCKAGGKKLNGLVKRRNKELELFKKKVKHYPKYTGNTESIVQALLEVGESNTSFAYRKKIANENGISNYKGTALQNITMLSMLKNGTLKHP